MTDLPENTVHQLFMDIDTFVLDIDGVMTDGLIHITESGEELCRMHIRDGFAIRTAADAGYRIFVISGGRRYGVSSRLQRLGCKRVILGVVNKDNALQELIAREGLVTSRALYMGDDLPDLDPMLRCRIAACPADAAPEVYQASAFVSQYKGGEGCVRDVIEQVLRVQGKWPAVSRTVPSA